MNKQMNDRVHWLDFQLQTWMQIKFCTQILHTQFTVAPWVLNFESLKIDAFDNNLKVNLKVIIKNLKTSAVLNFDAYKKD